MPIPITIPRLGWNMEEGVFVGWLKPDGAPVRAGEALFSLESDKAMEEIECLDEGILRIAPDGPRVGDKIAVGTVIGYLAQAKEAVSFERQTPRSVQTMSEKQSGESGSAANATVFAPERGMDRGQVAISPRAKRAARELGMDWTKLQGSGRTGRIRERDVRTASEVPSLAALQPSPLRRTIAERMVASHRSTAPVTLTTTADATHLVNLRNQFKAAIQAGNDVVPSFTDFLVKLSALALKRHPQLNARWADGQILLCPDIHIGIAVDTEAGLLVPVVRDALSLGLKQLSARSRDLIERARQRKLAADEMRGGTFTVTNLGAFGIDAFTPLINVPECAILGVGRIQRKPVVNGEQVVIRDQMTLSLTFDHRIVDGAPSARFLQTLSSLIENPGPWLIT